MHPGLLLCYIGLLLVVGLTSPGHGLLGEMIASLGSGLMSWMHIPAFALLCWLLAGLFRRRDWPPLYAWTAGAACTFVCGLWLEVLQGSVEGRVTTGEDLATDTLGIMLAGAVATYRTVRRTAPLRSPLG